MSIKGASPKKYEMKKSDVQKIPINQTIITTSLNNTIICFSVKPVLNMLIVKYFYFSVF